VDAPNLSVDTINKMTVGLSEPNENTVVVADKQKESELKAQISEQEWADICYISDENRKRILNAKPEWIGVLRAKNDDKKAGTIRSKNMQVSVSDSDDKMWNVSLKSVDINTLIFIDTLLHKHLTEQQKLPIDYRHYLFLPLEDIMLASRNAINDYFGRVLGWYPYEPS